MTELSPNELMIRLTGILQEKIDKDGQPFDFYSPDNPSLVLYPHQIQAITFGYMKPEELPQAASNLSESNPTVTKSLPQCNLDLL